MNKPILIGVVVVAVIAVLLFIAFGGNDDTLNNDANIATTTQNGVNTPGQNDPNTTNTNTGANTNDPANTQAQPSNQVVLGEVESGNVVTVTQATLTEPGYVVLYRINSNGETSVAGNSDLLEAGTHSNISVQLAATAVDRQAIVAVLHEDDGDEDFDYPETDGYLLNASGVVVNDIDVVGVSRSDRESQILEAQVETYLENNFNASAN